jgi:hypothetical protein
MKSELKYEPTHTFPALYKAIPCGAVVLFTDTCTGMVVKDSTYQTLGDFCDCFVNCTSGLDWQRLPSGSQVVLTQD